MVRAIGRYLLFKDGSWDSPSPHQSLIETEKLVEIGRGTRRVCYRVGDTGFCAKFYYPEAECTEALKMQKSIQRDVRRRRFDKFRNSSSEEVFVYDRLRRTLPDAVRDRLPPVCERVFHPEWGWGVLETYYANPDGRAIQPYKNVIRDATDPAVKAAIYRQARDLLLSVAVSRACFYEPGNFHVLFGRDGTLTLKLIDFEPEPKTAIPLEMVFPALREMKLKRKAKRFLAHIRKAYRVDVPVETEIG